MKMVRFGAGVLYAFIYLPLLIVLAESFNASPFGVGWAGWTLQWYRGVLHNPSALAAVKITLLLALCSTAISTFFGTLLGYATEPDSFHCLRLIRRSTRGFKLRIGALLIACLVAASTAQPGRLVSLQ